MKRVVLIGLSILFIGCQGSTPHTNKRKTVYISNGINAPTIVHITE